MRKERFTFLINESERELITILADHLQRSQSDAIRFVIVEQAKKLLSGAPDARTASQDVVEHAAT